MKSLLEYVNRNWGVAQTCTHCGVEAVAHCGGCLEYVYCGAQCQTKHWNTQHKYQCIAGKDEENKKREREEEEEEDVNPGETKRIEISSTDLTDLTSDVWQHIALFLNTKDLKNLNAVHREIQKRIRRCQRRYLDYSLWAA
jgi:aspartate oxidase